MFNSKYFTLGRPVVSQKISIELFGKQAFCN